MKSELIFSEKYYNRSLLKSPYAFIMYYWFIYVVDLTSKTFISGKLKLNINLRKHYGLSVHFDEAISKIHACMINDRRPRELWPFTCFEIIKNLIVIIMQ